jgi:hypothetical protein
VGILPLAEVKSFLFGHALVSLPFCAVAGIAAADAEAVEGLRQAAQDLGERLRVAHLELRHARPRSPGWPQQDSTRDFARLLRRRSKRTCSPSHASSAPWCERASATAGGADRTGRRRLLCSTLTTSTGTGHRRFPSDTLSAARDVRPGCRSAHRRRQHG